jgi:hypothetical protein
MILAIGSVALVSADVTVPTYVSVYGATMDLENKNTSTWVPIVDGIGGTLGYNLSGPTFDYGLNATGLADGDYSMIYYADTGDRYDDWGGVVATGVGRVIGTGVSSGGVLMISGSVELNMDLPCLPDANAYFYDYTQAPDGYANATGAKIWVVPTSVLTSGAMPVSTWTPNDNWLFETNLINYDDTDVAPLDLIAISVTPESVDFGILAPGQTGTDSAVVANIGLVSVDVSITIPATGIFKNIVLDWGIDSDAVATIGFGNSDTAQLSLTVPGGYTPAGSEIGSITFNAVVTPTP